jgi:phospho-N-acetylmuramoyl-pentapeptide-transferase
VKALLISAAVSLVVALLGTPVAIRVFSRHGYGQPIREEGPAGHADKRGTPTMGGTVMIIATLVGYFAGHLATGESVSVSGLLVLFLMTGLGAVGFADDFIKLYKQRSLGLRSGAKLAGQVIVGVVFAILALHFPDGYDLTPASTHLSFLADFGISIGPIFFVAFVVAMVAGTSNAVNLTDGLDGLAAGSATFCFGVLSIIGYWQFRHFAIYHLHSSLDLGLVAVGLVGACLGFLWWNAAPARIIMGDTGSLAIGTGLGALCLLMDLDLLLVIIGGLFVAETASVILQVVSFRLFGRRIFRMAPFHHHFELRGWPETTVIIRFWILAGLLAMLGLGIFYGDFLKIGKVV